jgi:hypothetical protein
VPCAVLLASGQAFAGGLIGNVFTWVGDRTGLKPIQQFGTALDQAHADVKRLVPPYGWIEEQTSDLVRRQFLAVCESAYQSITQPLIAYCANTSQRMSGGDKIQEARHALVEIGMFSDSEFNGVAIRACPLSSSAEGIAPDRNVVFLRSSALNDDPVDFGALLAHEMTHLRQYVREGSDRFKCAYSQAYVGCGLCQSDANSFEREAYAVQSDAARALANHYGAGATGLAAQSAQPDSFDPDKATGRVTIVNQATTPIVFFLESQSRSQTQFVLMPGQWSAYTASLPDEGFNIRIMTAESGQPAVIRTYGLQSGGTYYLAYVPQGYVDLLVVPGSTAVNTSNPTILGVQFGETPPDAGFRSRCAYVFSVAKGEPAEKAGIRAGDLITTIDGQFVTVDSFESQLRSFAGKTVELGLRRESDTPGKTHGLWIKVDLNPMR